MNEGKGKNMCSAERHEIKNCHVRNGAADSWAAMLSMGSHDLLVVLTVCSGQALDLDLDQAEARCHSTQAF